MPSDKSKSMNLSVEELLQLFSSSSLRKRRTLISSIEDRSDELIKLENAGLNLFEPNDDDWGAGWILQVLNRHQPEFLHKLLDKKGNGWLNTFSSKDIDYGPLQKSLLEERFEDADRYTNSILRQLASPSALERGYVYFSEVKNIPSKDLISIDRLWLVYSQAKFGFSVQGRLLDGLGGRYELLWPKIGWKKDGVWTRYPGSFDWTITAPEGHMPLINQLRGVRLIDALLNHPEIILRREKKT